MKKAILLFAYLAANASFFISNSLAGKTGPDTVRVGIYINGIHNIDFQEQQYSIDLWLWFKYYRPEFDLARNLEIPMATNYTKEYITVDTSEDGRIYVLMKLQCLMRGTWGIEQYPFDQQVIRFGIISSAYDLQSLVFSLDTLGNPYDKYFLRGWAVDSFKINMGRFRYDTTFGDEYLDKPNTEYSSFQIKIQVHRNAWQLFFKLFTGLYISFLITLVCFFIPISDVESRITLSVGAFFAIMANKYAIDSILPVSDSYTLVDILNYITLIFILLATVSFIYLAQLVRQNRTAQAVRFENVSRLTLLLTYVLLNIYFIFNACTAVPEG